MKICSAIKSYEESDPSYVTELKLFSSQLWRRSASGCFCPPEPRSTSQSRCGLHWDPWWRTLLWRYWMGQTPLCSCSCSRRRQDMWAESKLPGPSCLRNMSENKSDSQDFRYVADNIHRLLNVLNVSEPDDAVLGKLAFWGNTCRGWEKERRHYVCLGMRTRLPPAAAGCWWCSPPDLEPSESRQWCDCDYLDELLIVHLIPHGDITRATFCLMLLDNLCLTIFALLSLLSLVT